MKQLIAFALFAMTCAVLAGSAQAQDRSIRARYVIMDDGAGHNVTLMPPTGMTGDHIFRFPMTGDTILTHASLLEDRLDVQYGGTGWSSYTIGDMLYANTTGSLGVVNRAGIASGNVLSLHDDGGGHLVPGWSTPAPTGVTSVTAGTGLSGGTITSTGTISLPNVGPGAFTYPYATITLDAQGRVTAASSSTTPVTSVTGTTDRITVTGTTTPAVNIAATYAGQSSITTLGTVATGTWNATTIATTKGGTGLTSYATGDLLYASAANTLSKLPISTNGFILKIDSGNVKWLPGANASTAAIFAGQTSSGMSNASGDTNYYMAYGQTAGGTKDYANLSFKLNEMRVPRAATVLHLYVDLTVAPGAGHTRYFTIRNISTGTDLAPFAISDLAKSGNSGLATLTVSAGDIIVFKAYSNGGAAGSECVWSFEVQ